MKKSSFSPLMRWVAVLMSFCMLLGATPALADETDGEFKNAVDIKKVSLLYANDNKEVEENDVLDDSTEMILRYDFNITEVQAAAITSDTAKYKLNISEHLRWSSTLEEELKFDSGEVFGKLHSDSTDVWVTFVPGEIEGGIHGAHIYLHCNRAADVPTSAEGEESISENHFVMKFENGTQLKFGFDELAPLEKEAEIKKANGSVSGKTITWTIKYTPWQNPDGTDGVNTDTAFEIRDEIDATKHTFVDGSLKVDGTAVTIGTGRPETYTEELLYAFTETDGTLVIGGMKFNAGAAKKGDIITPLEIEYQTEILDSLLLGTVSGGSDITVDNEAKLYTAGDGGIYLSVSDNSTAEIEKPTWITKNGETVRTTGDGATTNWTVVFDPCGFKFDAANELTIYDLLPEYSTLVDGSVKIKVGESGTETTLNSASTPILEKVTGDSEVSFKIHNVVTDKEKVTITYQTKVPESVYYNGDKLGENKVWFSFKYYGEGYEFTPITAAIGSGHESGGTSTAPLEKKCLGYDSKTRSIEWKITINPHGADFTSGTFTDDLKIGPVCGVDGHTMGLMLVDSDGNPITGTDAGASVKDKVEIDFNSSYSTLADKVSVSYDTNRVLKIYVQDIGTNTLTLTYKTKICDPCVFANNHTTAQKFPNKVEGTMTIGGTSGIQGEATATAEVKTTVLTKKEPVYDYETGLMKWTVEVNQAGLPMEGIILTDELPAGLTYKAGSLKVDGTTVADPTTTVEDGKEKITITLGDFNASKTVTFETEVDWETLGFTTDKKDVTIQNEIRMDGKADGVEFEESSTAKRTFTNHGLVKNGDAKASDALIEYKVLINPYRLTLPENATLVDTMDPRLQLDWDSLKLNKITLKGDTGTGNKAPDYTLGDSIPVSVESYNAADNSFTVKLPIPAGGETGAYLLTYTADIIQYEAGSYTNSVSLENSTFVMGGSDGTSSSANLAAGGGGGGGAVAKRKATISIVKKDSETGAVLPDVTFALYFWDTTENQRGLLFAEGTTDSEGKLTFLASPNTTYELVEMVPAEGYGSAIGYADSLTGVSKTDRGTLKITTGEKNTKQELTLTNEAKTIDLPLKLRTTDGIPPEGYEVELYSIDPTTDPAPTPVGKYPIEPDGTVKIPSLRKGPHYIKLPGEEIYTITVEVPDPDSPPTLTVKKSDGTPVDPTETIFGAPPAGVWSLTVKKVIAGAGTGLGGAQIGLYADSSCTILLKEATTASDGLTTFDGLMPTSKTYYVKEIAAPSGYQLNGNVFDATKEAPIVEIENTPIRHSSGGSGGGSSKPVHPEEISPAEKPADEPILPGTEIPGAEELLPGTETPGTEELLPSTETPIPGLPAEEIPGTEPAVPAFGNGDETNTASEGTLGDGASASDTTATMGSHISNPDIPQTGDPTRFLATVTLLSALALAAMTAHELRMKKKHEK